MKIKKDWELKYCDNCEKDVETELREVIDHFQDPNSSATFHEEVCSECGNVFGGGHYK